ncbi:DUF1294 domain-containing protein [Uruburuella testudinis]|uniref:DUF1294 domain-containing protein n=2 Tax=Uruburuella testudinis TaxID=1282863 RepID=A0ABY4DUY3_9NEIS|nr:DUF1294 domain-containing protein [Uruburuella testudinis]
MSNGKGGRKHRIAEKSLHVVALAGGWPGAQLGRLVFRHKTVKASFIHRFWLMAALNVAITFGMLYYNR